MQDMGHFWTFTALITGLSTMPTWLIGRFRSLAEAISQYLEAISQYLKGSTPSRMAQRSRSGSAECDDLVDRAVAPAIKLEINPLLFSQYGTVIFDIYAAHHDSLL
jgi:hypothetical protein